MPQRRGFAGALHGIGEAGEEGVQLMFRQQMAQRNAQEQANRALFKDYTDRVITGMLDPDQAERGLTAQGVRVPKGYFSTLQPSVTQRLQTALGPVNAATSAANFPTPEQTNLALQEKGVNPIAGSGSPFTQAGSFDETNPTAASIYGAKQQALTRAVPPQVTSEGAMGTGPDIQSTRTFEQFNPFAGGFTNPVVRPTGPTAGQRGTASAEEELTKIIEGNRAGLPRAKAEAFNTEEELTRGAKAKTAGATTAASTQAGIDVNTLPSNVSKEASAKATIETAVQKAKDDLALAGVPPVLSESFIHTTDTGIPYVFMDPATPKDIRDAVTKRVPSQIPGVRFVNKDQNDALQQVGSARGNIRTYLDAYKDALPKSPEGRLIGGPRNTFDILSQRNPTLTATYNAMYGPMIEIFRASTAGVRGFRMTAAEISQANKAIPLPTDTWETAVQKARILGNVFADIEKQIVGMNKPAPR